RATEIRGKTLWTGFVASVCPFALCFTVSSVSSSSLTQSTKTSFNLIPPDGSRPDEASLAGCCIDDCGRQTAGQESRIDQEIDPIAKHPLHIVRIGRCGFSADIGAGGGNRPAACL